MLAASAPSRFLRRTNPSLTRFFQDIDSGKYRNQKLHRKAACCPIPGCKEPIIVNPVTLTATGLCQTHEELYMPRWKKSKRREDRDPTCGNAVADQVLAEFDTRQSRRYRGGSNPTWIPL